MGAVFSGPVKALGLAPLGYQTEHHSAQLISRVRTVFPARQALHQRSHRHLTPDCESHTEEHYINSSINQAEISQNSCTRAQNKAPGFEVDWTSNVCQVM